LNTCLRFASGGTQPNLKGEVAMKQSPFHISVT
jgi:hypothetical protein